MQSHGVTYLYGRFRHARHHPLSGQIDLTYRCDFACVHCYCKESEPFGRELSTAEIKKILDDIAEEGCLWLALTGGDPLVRPDFKEIYLYARRKGFIIAVLTNGHRLDAEMIKFFVKYPPFSLDVTLNSLKERAYRQIVGLPHALSKVKRNITLAAKAGLNVIVKANCLKENKSEIGAIKRWTEKILGKPEDNLYRFRYDKIIFPRLNGSPEPYRHRLSPAELSDIPGEDEEMDKEYCHALKNSILSFKNKVNPLYLCDTWKTTFYIDPYGRLKFCPHSHKFLVDLRKQSFHDGFYNEFPKIAKEKFKTKTLCRKCDLRRYCCSCPAVAYLEAGDEEQPAEYFCQIAHQLKKEILAFKK